MAISKQIQSPNGVILNYHKLNRFECNGDFSLLTVYLYGFGSEKIATNDGPFAWLWSLSLPSGSVKSLSQETIEQLLVESQESPFFGGVRVSSLETELESARRLKWQEIKGFREAVETRGFTWDGSVFDSDTISQTRIQGAFQLAMLSLANNTAHTVDWTLMDNTVRTLTAADVLALGQAMTQHVKTCHARSRILREQIESAATIEQVQAVRWVY